MTEPSHTPTDLMGVLTLVLHQMSEMKRELLAHLDESAESAAERWTCHEREHEKQVALIKALEERLDDHLQQERDEEIVMAARLGPIRSAGSLIAREWRTVLIIVLVVLNMLERIFGNWVRGSL